MPGLQNQKITNMNHKFEIFPRVPLIQQATPFLPLDRLTELFNVSLWIKRDDMNGVGAGGNKVRKLEYLLADAKQNNASAIITGGGVQSNHASTTAICAKRLGLKSYLALVAAVPIENEHYQSNGNVFLNQLCNAEIKRFPKGSNVNKCIEQYAQEIEKLTGSKPYEICMGGSNVIGSLGYIKAALEIASQMKAHGIKFASLVHASGSAGTQAGLIVGFYLAGADVDVLGCSVVYDKPKISQMVLELCQQLSQLLGITNVNWAEKINVNDSYIGDGYGLPGKATWESIDIGIETESIIFDPCYTGKAFNYLLDLLREQSSLLRKNTIFLHTGGMVGLMGYQNFTQKIQSDQSLY